VGRKRENRPGRADQRPAQGADQPAEHRLPVPAHRRAGFTTLPLLPLIRQRTLVLTGDQDPIIPVANGRILAAGIPHAKLHIYHGGHVELVTRPSLLTPLITSFLAAPPHDARRR